MVDLLSRFSILVCVSTLCVACSDRPVGSCSPDNCEGCCQAGACREGDLDSTCGTGGQQCADCAAGGQVCTPARVCGSDCGSHNCDGCCDDTGQCLPGDEAGACGTQGALCTACADGERCDAAGAGACVLDVPCLPGLCEGCCDAEGYCRSGTSNRLCGAGAEACLDCEALGASCSAEGACVDPQQDCGPGNCPGCCAAADECVVGTSPTRCGHDGEACQDCGDQVCDQGECVTGCQDQDRDGYGPGCALGEDCDDQAPGIVGSCKPDGCPQGWAYVPAGSFIMGCDEGDLGCSVSPIGDPEPEHVVHMSDYCIQETKVTVDMYRACKLGNVCMATPCVESSENACKYSEQPGVNNDFPVTGVHWHDARWLCRLWYGGDLPTEAQWEKGARGTDGRAWPWGDSPEPNCEITYMPGCDAGGYFVEVGQYPQSDSPFGLQDTYGMIEEWALDEYSSTFYAECGDSCTDPSNQPSDPTAFFLGVVRGYRDRTWEPPVVHDNIAARLRIPVQPPGDPEEIGWSVRCARPWP